MIFQNVQLHALCAYVDVPSGDFAHCHPILKWSQCRRISVSTTTAREHTRVVSERAVVSTACAADAGLVMCCGRWAGTIDADPPAQEPKLTKAATVLLCLGEEEFSDFAFNCSVSPLTWPEGWAQSGLAVCLLQPVDYLVKAQRASADASRIRMGMSLYESMFFWLCNSCTAQADI